jgi:hypothetical protein
MKMYLQNGLSHVPSSEEAGVEQNNPKVKDKEELLMWVVDTIFKTGQSIVSKPYNCIQYNIVKNLNFQYTC